MWIMGVGINRICLFHYHARFNQGAACNKLNDREDDEARADKPNVFCSCCSPGYTGPGAHSPPPETKEDGTAMDLCWFSSHCLKIAAFWHSTNNRELQRRYSWFIFYWILSLKKAPVKSMSITLKHASFRTNHFISPSFISQLLQGEFHWLPVLLSSKHCLRARPRTGGKCLSAMVELETAAVSPGATPLPASTSQP